MNPRLPAVLLALLLASCPLVARAADPQVLTEGWRFLYGPGPADVERADYDDSGWQPVRVPHDWAVAGPFDANGDGDTGRLPWKGEGWYRRSFELPANDGAQRVYLDFDGVMAFPKVYVNGEFAGEWDYGYSSFRVDVTDQVEWGGKNLLAVHVDTRRWGSRWYPGAGIYRKVTLQIEKSVHIAHWGVQVLGTVDAPSPKARVAGTARVGTTIENHRDEAVTVHVAHRLRDPMGEELLLDTKSAEIPAGESVEVEQILELDEVSLWDIDDPRLYTLVTTVAGDGGLFDLKTTRFGFRDFEFTADDGFHLNGRRVQLRGVNLHHDLGPLGAAFNKRAARRQLEIMRDMGANALRTSHNPPAPEMLELCDEMGIVVWDEAFDKWAWTAGRPDLQPPLPEFAQRHIASMVRRDFNHPSVVTWSVGNEIWPDEKLEGINPERVGMMMDFAHGLDPSRPASMACHIPSLVDGKNFKSLDLAGWNYGRRYANYRKQYPKRPVVYSESASTLSTRGFYDPQLPDRATDYPASFQVSSYDLSAAYWSDIPDVEFRLMEQDRFVAGEFVWTGIDYLGEPTPFAEQARSSYFGAVDLCGFPKDRFWLYRSHWKPEATTVHILPHWNWPERVGQNVPVFVYTNGDAAELFLNGESLGVRRKGEVPKRAPNLALKAKTEASASPKTAGAAVDGSLDSAWEAGGDAAGTWWRVDLGQALRVNQLWVDTLQKENAYAYTIEASLDGNSWQLLVDHPTRPIPQWNGPSRMIHTLKPLKARHLRLTFDAASDGRPYGLKEFQVFAEPVENDYFDVTYDYRLRWNEVSYQPGELRAVAYRDGEEIGEAQVETAGPPAALRLSTDRDLVRADGEDLAFVTVEALDSAGRPNPLAENLVHFTVTGAGHIEAVGNGNPLSFEPFQADRRQLFYGKALLILRPDAGEGGAISVEATSPGLGAASLKIDALPGSKDHSAGKRSPQ